MAEQSSKRARKADGEDEQVRGGLHLKPHFAKRPWYMGGKVLVTRDGSTCFCAYDGGLAVVKDFNTVTKILAPGDDVISFTLASGPETVVTCSRKGLIRVFMQPELKETRNFASMHAGIVSEMDIDPTGECLATGSTDFGVRVFSVSGGYATHNFKGHRGIVSAVKFHPNEGNLLLATADVGGAIALWDLRTRKHTWFRNHLSVVPSLAFLGESLLVSVGRDRVLSVWSKDSPSAPLKTIPTYESMETVVALDGTTFATGGADGMLKKWKFDVKKNECQLVQSIEDALNGDAIFQLNLLRPGVPNQPKSKKSDTSNTVLLTISQTESIFVFRSPVDLEKEVKGRMIGFDDEVYDLSFMPGQGCRSLAVATNSPIVRVYDFDDNGQPSNVRLLVGHSEAVLSISAHPDFFVTGSKDQTAKVWSTETFECLATCEGHVESVASVSTCNKPHHRFFATGSDDCSIRLWSLVGKDSIEVVASDQRVAHTKAITDVCFAPNDEILASASADRTCKLWTVEVGKKGVKLTGNMIELKGHRRAVNSVRFSSVDRVVCTSSADTTVRVWSIATGACVRTLQSHSSPVTSALFMTNGTSIVSSGADGTIKAWDLKSSSCVQTLFGVKDGGHESRIWSLALVQDGEDEQYVASVGVEGVICVWRDATKEEREKQMELEKQEILQREELDRSLRERQYLKAAKLALKLDRPHQLRQILEQVPTSESTAFIKSLISETDAKQTLDFLNAISNWNTLSRTSLVAQRSIAACMEITDELQTKVGKGAIENFVKAALPYTERHFSRIDRLLRGSYLLDRVLETTSSV